MSPQQQALDRGFALLEQRRVRSALAAFEEACSPEPRPRCIWMQIVAHDELRQFLRAAQLIPRYIALANARDPSFDAVTGHVLANVGRVRVIPDGNVPTGVTFSLDGARLQASQVGGDVIYVEPGERVVEARGEGREPVRLAVQVAAGADRSVSVPVPEERVPVTRRWWFWTVIGAAVAGGVATAVVLATREGPAPIPNVLGSETQAVRW
ncbi:MAG: hypothetical protein U0324_16080 [Polyangiales bacterium]